MNQAQWAAYKSALKTLDAGPRKIEKAREEYRAASEYMQQHKRTYSEAAQERYYETARAKRDTAIKGEVAKIAKALETVREYRNFPNEKIDLSSTKLMNAITVTRVVGKKMRPDEQLGIAEQFRGEPAALHFLADLYRQNGLYYADYVDSMAAPVSDEAIQNLEYCLGSYEMLGKWPFDEKCYWTQHEFAEAATRLGFDVADGKDVYVEALKDARKGKSPEEQRIISEAIIQIQRGNEYGMSDAQKATIFNGVTDKLQALVNKAEAAEITRQAATQESLDAIRAAANGPGDAQQNDGDAGEGGANYGS
jgi:hypothetical protein